MLKFGNKEFRNLQEQVEKNMKDILFILQEEGVLNEFGIKVIGQEDTAANMPTVSDYKENNPDWAYGDAYAIGTKAPYTLYILTRANGTHPNDYWFNIGSFPVTGPQGPQGPQGEVGPQGPTGNPGTNGLDAGFGTINATAETVSSTDPATVTITTSGPNTAKNISFAFEIPQGEKGKDGASEWGEIGGSLENQTDLVNALQAKQNASNAVTTDGTQTITGQKTFNNIKLSGTAYTNNVKTNGTYLALQGVDGALTLGGKVAQFNVPIVPTGTTQSIGASERLWKDLYLSGNLSDGTNSISVADIAPKSEYATKKDFDDLKSIVYGIHSLTYNSYEFPYLTTSVIPDEVDGRKVVGGSYAIADWVGGNSVSFNQQCKIQDSSQSETKNGITITDNRDGSYTFNGTATDDVYKSLGGTLPIIIGHKYLIKGGNGGSSSTYYLTQNSGGANDYGNGVIYTQPDNSYGRFMIVVVKSGTTMNNVVFRPQHFDLTLMGLGNITTVSEFNAMFPLDYYPYNSGEIKSTIVSKIESWGYNLCNEIFESGTILRGEDYPSNLLKRTPNANKIKVIAGKQYTLEGDYTGNYYIFEFDYNMNYIRRDDYNNSKGGSVTLLNNCSFVRLVVPTDATKVCFHLTGSRTGYAPYVGKLGEIAIPNAPLKLDGVNAFHNTVTFEEQEDGSYNAILTSNILILDLGTINWGTPNSNGWVQTTDKINAKPNESASTMPNAICDKYTVGTPNKAYTTDGYISINTSSYVTARDSSFIGKTKDEMKTTMSGVHLLCELATPTSEVIATGLSFDDTTLKIEKGGTIKAVYEGVPPTTSIDFMTKGE